MRTSTLCPRPRRHLAVDAGVEPGRHAHMAQVVRRPARKRSTRRCPVPSSGPQSTPREACSCSPGSDRAATGPVWTVATAWAGSRGCVGVFGRCGRTSRNRLHVRAALGGSARSTYCPTGECEGRSGPEGELMGIRSGSRTIGVLAAVSLAVGAAVGTGVAYGQAEAPGSSPTTAVAPTNVEDFTRAAGGTWCAARRGRGGRARPTVGEVHACAVGHHQDRDGSSAHVGGRRKMRHGRRVQAPLRARESDGLQPPQHRAVHGLARQALVRQRAKVRHRLLGGTAEGRRHGLCGLLHQGQGNPGRTQP